MNHLINQSINQSIDTRLCPHLLSASSMTESGVTADALLLLPPLPVLRHLDCKVRKEILKSNIRSVNPIVNVVDVNVNGEAGSP